MTSLAVEGTTVHEFSSYGKYDHALHEYDVRLIDIQTTEAKIRCESAKSAASVFDAFEGGKLQ